MKGLADLREEKFFSKKNNVYKRERVVEGKKQWLVEKEFTDVCRYYREMGIMQQISSSGLAVPRVLWHQPPGPDNFGVITYQYIVGLTVLEYLEQDQIAQCADMLKEIIRWLADFYRVTKELLGEQWILGDIHLKNFIHSSTDNCLYGLDFEEACPGLIEQDIAKLLVYIPTYQPAYTPEKLKLAADFVKEAAQTFGLAKADLLCQVEREVAAMSARRNSRVDPAVFIALLK